MILTTKKDSFHIYCIPKRMFLNDMLFKNKIYFSMDIAHSMFTILDY